MIQPLNIEFERAVRLLCEHLPVSNEDIRKPILFHDIRVGVYLYEHGYSRDVVLAGVLHDILEFTTVSPQVLQKEFGDRVAELVMANTKDDSIKDPEKKTVELITRCITHGQDALIVKAADILDSFTYYTATRNEDQLRYCARNAEAIFKYKLTDFTDPIFDELQRWRK